MGYSNPHPHQQLTLRSWARSLSTSSGRSGCATVNAGTPGWGGHGGAQGHGDAQGNVGEHTPKTQEETDLPTLKMPPFCQAIFSMVSPRMLVWSMPREETPHTTGALGMQHGSVPAVPPTLWGHETLAALGTGSALPAPT